MDQLAKLGILGIILFFVIGVLVLIELYRAKQIDLVEALSLLVLLISSTAMEVILWAAVWPTPPFSHR